MTDYIEHDSIPTFQNESYAIFNQLRHNNELCDVAILVSGTKLNAHKIILSSASPYFRKMFTVSMMEADMKEIRIPNVTEETMEQIMQFIYTGKFLISAETAQNILIAANFLQIDSLVNLCARYIIKEIDDTNCFSMKDLLMRTNCDAKIVAKAMDYINLHFTQLTQDDSFLQLDINDAVELLSSSDICCESEEDVCHGAIRWLNANISRKKYAQQIFNCIRLSFLSSTFKSEHIDNNPLFSTNLINRNIESCTIPREYKKTCILAVSNGKAFFFWTFDPITKQWRKCLDVEQEHYQKFATNGEQVFVSGQAEDNGSQFFNYLDVKTKKWTFLNSLPRNYRIDVDGLVVIDKKCYVFSAEMDLFKLFVYDMTTNCWHFISTTGRESRFNKSSQFVAFGKYVYAFTSAKCQKLDLETRTWTDIRSMISCDSNNEMAGIATYKRKIFLAWDSMDNLPNIFEMYDPEENQWKKLAPMVSVMRRPILVATTDGVYAIGLDSNTRESHIEFYDMEEDKWIEQGKCPSGFAVYGATACAVPYFFCR